jgi:hypothetical protein
VLPLYSIARLTLINGQASLRPVFMYVARLLSTSSVRTLTENNRPRNVDFGYVFLLSTFKSGIFFGHEVGQGANQHSGKVILT